MYKTKWLLIACFAVGWLSSQDGLAGDLPLTAKMILGNKFEIDQEMTSRAEVSNGELIRATYPQSEGLKVEIWILKGKGSIQDTFDQLDIPKNAEVKPPKTQGLSPALSILAGMFADALKSIFGEDWPKRAVEKAKQVDKVFLGSFKVTVNYESGGRADEISVEGLNPWMDYKNLEIFDGTWLQVTRISYTKSDRSRVERRGDSGILRGAFEAMRHKTIGLNQCLPPI